MQFIYLRLMFLLILAETNLPMLSAKSMIRDNGPVKRNDAPCKLKITGNCPAPSVLPTSMNRPLTLLSPPEIWQIYQPTAGVFMSLFLHLLEMCGVWRKTLCKGPWADFINITVTPNPPRLGEYIHLTVDAIVKESVWLLTMRWNGTLDGGDIHGSDQRILCDINKHTDMCPAKKGDTRHYEKELNPGFLPQGSYSGQLQILDEKDEVAITVRVDHCTFK